MAKSKISEEAAKAMVNVIDVLEFLSKVVQENTEHYKTDFHYDRNTLKKAADAYDTDDRAFYWMSRRDGTWCVKEREAFIRGSGAHSIWTYYADEPEGIRAYRVQVTGKENGKVMGTVQRIEYREQVRRVLERAIPATGITLCRENGLTETVPYSEYRNRLEVIKQGYGGIRKVRYEVADDTALDRVIAAELRELQGRKAPHKCRKHRGR